MLGLVDSVVWVKVMETSFEVLKESVESTHAFAFTRARI